MLTNENIICISSIDWNYLWQGHHEIMSTFAGNGNRVLFIENTGVRTPGIKDMDRIRNRLRNFKKGINKIRKESKNLYVFSPVALPFPYSRLATLFNKCLMLNALKSWMKKTYFSNPIIWVFLPTPLTLDIINSIKNKLVVYYCIDNLKTSSAQAERLNLAERLLIKRSNIIFATSQMLFDKCSKIAESHTKVYKFPFGVNLDNFYRAKSDTKAAEGIRRQIKDMKRPVIGYIGAIHKWLDLGLIAYLASTFKYYSFVFVGPFQIDISALRVCQNIYFLGQKNIALLPHYINTFDVCLIPYRITQYTECVYPTKLNEYLAAGKPVISTNIKEMRIFDSENPGLIELARDKNEFAVKLKKCAEERQSDEAAAKRIEVAKTNSWPSRIEKMSSVLELEIDTSNKD